MRRCASTLTAPRSSVSIPAASRFSPAASRGEQHGVPVDFVFSACLCVGHGDPDAPGGVAHRFDPRAYAEFDALFFQRLPYGGRNVAVFARDQLRKPFEHGDFRSE